MCVYCNWDQSARVPDTPLPGGPTPSYTPPPDHRARNKILGTVGLVVLVVVAFVVGALIHGFEPSGGKVAPTKQVAGVAGDMTVKPDPRADLTLVPFNGNSPELEQPITTAPPQAPGQQGADATALPSDQYAAVAAKAKAQKQTKAAPVDPREVRGTAFEDKGSGTPSEAPGEKRESRIASETAQPARTEAYPEYKPLPDFHVDRDTTARVVMTIGADGRVKDVDITQAIPGGTAQLIEAVQNWRFRPATENGTPVPAKVAVTIILHGNE